MSRIVAILILGMLLFNTGGYRLFLSFMESRHDQAQAMRFNNAGYEASELITIKVPANLPYFTNAPEWERMNGELIAEGQVYKYVERRIYNDSIEVRCLPDAVKTGMQAAREQFFALAHDLLQNSPNGKGTKASVIKPFVFEGFEPLQTPSFGVERAGTPISPRVGQSRLSAYSIAPVTPPPDRILS